MVKDIFRVLNQKCFDYMMKLLEPHKILMRQENENISLQIWFVVQRAGSGLCKFDSWCSVQAQGCAKVRNNSDKKKTRDVWAETNFYSHAPFAGELLNVVFCRMSSYGIIVKKQWNRLSNSETSYTTATETLAEIVVTRSST